MKKSEPGDKKTVQERITEEELIRERVDAQGNRWRKIYFGGGEHFRNWLEQFKELGEVMVEDVDPTGFQCFEQTGETLHRVWLKMDKDQLEELYG
ncbi:MAG: hypothetical protein PVG49_15670 [Desulfobacteraceae bacterium]|jgi:hypothetical protein